MSKSFQELYEQAVQAAHSPGCKCVGCNKQVPESCNPSYTGSIGSQSSTVATVPTRLPRNPLTRLTLQDILVREANGVVGSLGMVFRSEGDLIRAKELLANVGFRENQTGVYLHPKACFKVCIRRTPDGSASQLVMPAAAETTPFSFDSLCKEAVSMKEEMIEESAGDVTTKISKNQYGEYVVRLYIDGKYQPGSNYFTDDLEDARETAKHMKDNGGSFVPKTAEEKEIAAGEAEAFKSRKEDGERIVESKGDKVHEFNTSSGKITLKLTLDQAMKGNHMGECDADIAELAKVPSIRDQLKKIDPEVLKSELKETGGWDAEELEDHTDNLNRILWIACADIVEEMDDEDLDDDDGEDMEEGFIDEGDTIENYLSESECFWCEETNILTEGMMSESIQRKRVVRDGRVKFILKSNRKGYRIKNGQEIQMSAMEIMKKRRAAKKAWIKKRGRMGSMFSRRRKSYQTRARLHMG